MRTQPQSLNPHSGGRFPPRPTPANSSGAGRISGYGKQRKQSGNHFGWSVASLQVHSLNYSYSFTFSSFWTHRFSKSLILKMSFIPSKVVVVSSFGSVCSVFACVFVWVCTVCVHSGVRVRLVTGMGEAGQGRYLLVWFVFIKREALPMILLFVSPSKFICWNPDPRSGSVRMWGLWQVIRSGG